MLVVCALGAFFKAAFMHLCLPKFQVTVHKISEILTVMTENRTKALISSDTLSLKSQPSVEWEKVPCAEEMREHSAGSRSPLTSGSPPPRVPQRSLAAVSAVEHAQHRFFPSSLLWAVCVYLQLSSSDYHRLYCNLLIASHFWCHGVVVGQILCFLSSTPTAVFNFTCGMVEYTTPHKFYCMVLLRKKQPEASQTILLLVPDWSCWPSPESRQTALYQQTCLSHNL